MRRRMTLGLWVVLLVGSFWTFAAVADERTERIDAHLAAGEFAPALRLAEAIEDIPARDAQLTRIAVLQDRGDARRGAEATLQQIRDDRARGEALDQILAQRFDPPQVRPQFDGGDGDFGGGGGGNNADFDELIDLITTTIDDDSWLDAGGEGNIGEFAGGVMVDASGVLHRVHYQQDTGALGRQRLLATDSRKVGDVHQQSRLRKISLSRLERAVQIQAAAGKAPNEAMRNLAGITKIQFVFVYPDSGDLVLAGPAGDWRAETEGRVVSSESGRPVLRLDDLVVLMRHMRATDNARFGCSITPRQAALRETQSFLTKSATNLLRPGRRAREKWLDTIREKMGHQDIEIYGIDPRTRVARVLIEADYRMKLVGLGLEEGTFGVTSYLDGLPDADAKMDVLRWWFTLNHQAILATADGHGYELRGQGVQVKSENELLSEAGERVHTGKSKDPNRAFAESFTANFKTLAEKYPVYADLENVFDLALVAALVQEHKLCEQVGWHMSHLGDPKSFAVALGESPTEVETVLAHRITESGRILAGISGGVRCDPALRVAAAEIKTDTYGLLKAERSGAQPEESIRWWWD